MLQMHLPACRSRGRVTCGAFLLFLQVPTYDYTAHAVKGSEHDTVIDRPRIICLEGILKFDDPTVSAPRACKTHVVSLARSGVRSVL